MSSPFTKKMHVLLKVLIYFDIGMLCHLAFVGNHIGVGNPWSWIWLCAWPVALFVSGFLLMFALVLAVVGLALLVGIVADSDIRRLLFSHR